MPGPLRCPVPRRILFTAAIFAGSFLLFLIQPMIARIALPRLGGAPAVWNSAMVIYQLLLLGGYAYAYWLARQEPKVQAAVHLGAMLAAALLLPIGLSGTSVAPGISAYLWVPWLFLSSIGPLFFLISANAPLLQRWFLSSGRGGGDPYPLYAASNLGSFAGLIAYPLLLEPLLPVSEQRLLWTGGYAALLLLLIGCSLTLRGSSAAPAPSVGETAIDRQHAVKWVWLAFVPSGLMLATTQFITTDLMPMPLLWVLPLGLYLLSFTVAFSSRGHGASVLAMIAPYTLVPAAIALFLDDNLLPLIVGILLVALFAVSTACHLRIFQSRPDPRQLTGFYLAIALGGAFGGLFCALIAPLLFDWTYEYPLLLVAAAITLLPASASIVPGRWTTGPHASAAIAGIAIALVATAVGLAVAAPDNHQLVQFGSLAALAIGTVAVFSRLLMTGTMVAAMMLGGLWGQLELSAHPDRMIRTYFGVYSIVDSGDARQLLHGTTMHGAQLLTEGWERFPTTYYGRQSGVGRALQRVPTMFGQGARVSVVGLGAGTLACYRQPGQRWTFFELDPAVVDLATRSPHFSFVPLCAPQARMVIGDARLEIAREPPASADVLVVDAFSSDAVPMHLLTKEAFDIYGRYLEPDGLLLVHISNRHLNLEPVVSAVPGWAGRFGKFLPAWDYRQEVTSEWMVLSRSRESVERLVRLSEDGFWRAKTTRTELWTDDHASLLPVFR